MNSTQLLETAIQEYLKTCTFASWAVDASGQRNIYKATDSPDGAWQGSQTIVRAPLALVECSDCQPWPTSRNRKRRGTVRITVRTNRDDESELVHDARCKDVFAVFFDPNFQTLLNERPDFTVFDIRFVGDGSSRVARALESWIELSVDFIDSDAN